MRMSKWIMVIWLAASVWVLAANSPAPNSAAEAQDAAAPAGQKKTAAAKQAPEAEAGAESKVASKPRKRSLKHQRDPFVSPIVKRKGGGVKCTGTGRQCLFAGDLVLQGVVKHAGGYIAVVASGQHTYFLRDEDPLADDDLYNYVKLKQHLSIPILARSTPPPNWARRRLNCTLDNTRTPPARRTRPPPPPR